MLFLSNNYNLDRPNSSSICVRLFRVTVGIEILFDQTEWNEFFSFKKKKIEGLDWT
jgi:hypothetical protein